MKIYPTKKQKLKMMLASVKNIPCVFMLVFSAFCMGFAVLNIGILEIDLASSIFFLILAEFVAAGNLPFIIMMKREFETKDVLRISLDMSGNNEYMRNRIHSGYAVINWKAVLEDGTKARLVCPGNSPVKSQWKRVVVVKGLFRYYAFRIPQI